ncbi:MAG: methyltransferase domain-containing protein [Actinomycetota bacterium]
MATVEITSADVHHGRLFDAGHRHLVVGRATPTPYGHRAGLAPLPVDDGWCGVVVCVDVLEQLIDPLNLLTELNRMLTVGGRLYLVAPLVMKSGSALEPATRGHLGVNYLLETAGFTMAEHRLVRDRSDYAITACKVRSLSALRPVLPS